MTSDRANAIPPFGRARRRGFTAIEFVVVLGIVAILASIFIPYVLKVREENRRIACRDRLQQVFKAMQAYAADNGSLYPRAAGYDPARPLTVFAAVAPPRPPATAPAADELPMNNVTASLWLLVRGGYVKEPTLFLCPSRSGSPAPADVAAVDFPSPGALGYSYASPFGLSDANRLTDVLKPEFVLMADLNPGTSHAVARSAPLLELAGANSPNHRSAGQNVLYAYGSVEWQLTPYCGQNNDNIYTVRGDHGSTRPTSRPATENGSTDLSILPSADDDSFLLPTAAAVGGGG